ncbi:MAG: hypothetical protein A3F26_00190 [Candidatus Ryanbacteria bacterium RIFCSPHIGHO2_12_FULL_47_12b]|nr:MAG: hypothetical protein UX74_C0009G0014 [Parcubacteria group bacterium GW2011_GWA2_47_10b]OGZ46700.1 MAG: hypothetical protein A2844_02185 [Candidatus Ryanbacteria bacterium RIFCSPHIGHO2_01_FULL_48_80]OGZ48045.1 MAG: hypothetical protein A3C83_02770 [Candidatus Ryanbacteria bacterium RIFCSPHIGHO2_02_FULL_47_25]OGZ51362.1 MAG: hypothetical protein A3A29_01995 [Candidatus Ryanbacteria bacterium RIFCSPLOWO2_01_FULL_47_79]OGZ51828.1 MAG: hypothetical protein A3F26_00190 [Candidatus Ryanbacteri
MIMNEFPVEEIIVAGGYLGIFGLMIVNGFVSFPSSQILYIVAGFFISRGFFNFYGVAFVGALGNTIGNIILYEIARRKGLTAITRLKIFPEREVKKVQMAFAKRGAWFLFIGKLLPAIKVFVPIPAGIARMNRFLYTIIVGISSYLWALIFLALGFFFGKSADFLSRYTVILAIIAVAVVVIFYRYMNSKEVEREMDAHT